jgi:hypothetical protein
MRDSEQAEQQPCPVVPETDITHRQPLVTHTYRKHQVLELDDTGHEDYQECDYQPDVYCDSQFDFRVHLKTGTCKGKKPVLYVQSRI